MENIQARIIAAALQDEAPMDYVFLDYHETVLSYDGDTIVIQVDDEGLYYDMKMWTTDFFIVGNVYGIRIMTPEPGENADSFVVVGWEVFGDVGEVMLITVCVSCDPDNRTGTLKIVPFWRICLVKKLSLSKINCATRS